MARITFHIILHTHWDREWYLPRSAFQARLVPTVGAVLDLLERDPEARFVLDGQTIVAEDALDVRPDWIGRAADMVDERRLEVGPWYILADEIVPNGESLVRNLLQGSRDADALGGRMDVLYSPDAFGHPAALPTIAAQFGITAGVVWRGLGRPGGRDRDFYRWRGPDGAEMLLYHLPSQGYEIGADLAVDPGIRWRAIRAQLVGRAVTSHVAVFVGADHHAPPDDAGELRDAIQALESGNFVRLSSLDEFLKAARPEAGAASALSGELRRSDGHAWALQGTHATRARLKRYHGAVELYLQRQVEPLAALASWQAGLDQHGLLRTTSRTLLQCQFHDTICGCCSDLVAMEQTVRLNAVGASCREIVRRSLHALSGHDPDRARDTPQAATPALLIWNPAPHARGGIVTAGVTWFRRDLPVGPPAGRAARVGQGYRPFALRTTDGDTLPVQVLSITPGAERLDAARHYPDQDEVDRVRIAFELPAVAGLGLACLVPVPASASASPPDAGLHAASGGLANRFVEVHLAADGRIDLLDRRSGERFRNVLHLVDELDRGDSYTPYVRADTPAGRTIRRARPRVLASGPLLGAAEMRFAMPSSGRGDIRARMVVILHADSPLVRVRLEVDNRAVDHRLRLAIPVGAGGTAMAGAAFGFARRDPVAASGPEDIAEPPATTAPAQRYVAAGSGNRCLALLCPGFFEYEWTAGHELFVTVLRSIGELSRAGLPTRPGHAGWPMDTPDAQEPGRHVMELALVPIGESELGEPAELERRWADAFLAPQPTFVRDFSGDPVAVSAAAGIALEGRGLVCSAVKPAESGGGLILRCYNTEPVPVAGRWTSGASIATAALVRADETVVASIDVDDGRSARFTAPARGIVSVRITPETS